jgi:hypothetical protein
MARKASALRTELERAGISRQRLCEYRKLAAIPYPEFKKRLEDFKRNGKPITFRGIMRGKKEDSVIEEGQIKPRRTALNSSRGLYTGRRRDFSMDPYPEGGSPKSGNDENGYNLSATSVCGD